MKKVSKVFACIAAGVSLVAASLCTGCTAGSYTEEQHIQRVTERAKERFLGEGKMNADILCRSYQQYLGFMGEVGFRRSSVESSISTLWMEI